MKPYHVKVHDRGNHAANLCYALKRHLTRRLGSSNRFAHVKGVAVEEDALQVVVLAARKRDVEDALRDLDHGSTRVTVHTSGPLDEKAVAYRAELARQARIAAVKALVESKTVADATAEALKQAQALKDTKLAELTEDLKARGLEGAVLDAAAGAALEATDEWHAVDALEVEVADAVAAAEEAKAKLESLED